MYYENYEDYMRSILGYKIENKNIYQSDYSNEIERSNNAFCKNSNELNDYYPKIYKIINPIVRNLCNRNDLNINKENIEKIVEEVYKTIEYNNEININIKIENNTKEREIGNRNNYNNYNNYNKQNVIKNSSYNDSIILKDLIRILILNEIIRKNNNYDNKNINHIMSQNYLPFTYDYLYKK